MINASITSEEAERLLFQGESETLDFKVEQYRFAGAPDHAKAELLKDILAFANAWRDRSAVILIGVAEGAGRAHLVGIDSHLDDASLQQFVSSKTNRPVVFSYRELQLDDKVIGAIVIPKQDRPIFHLKPYGGGKDENGRERAGLAANVVYFRRGSTTHPADPDDVARMGRDDAAIPVAKPVFDLQFVDIRSGRAGGRCAKFDVHYLDFEKVEIPRFSHGHQPLMERVNAEFWWEAANYLKQHAAFARFRFSITNNGPAVANDVHAEFEIPADGGLFAKRDSEMPLLPVPSSNFLEPRAMPVMDFNSEFEIEKVGGLQRVKIDFGKVKPGDSSVTHGILRFAPTSDGELTTSIKTRILCDELPPSEVELLFCMQRTRRIFDSWEELEAILQGFIAD